MLFPLKVFTLDSAIVGRDDRYRSSVVGRKFSGWPKGIYVGFVPTVLPPSPILTLSIDPTEGYSLAKLPSSADPAGLDIILTTPLLVDLSTITTFPVYVTLRAAYYDDAASVAELAVYSTISSVPWNEALICTVSGPIGALTVLADPAAGTRQEPLALVTTSFGFMPAGSIETLATATDLVNEVVAARIGIDGTPYSTLSDRIAADYSTTGMASRLGFVLNSLRSNDYSAASGVGQVNVSGSFSEVNRDFNPKTTLSGLGSETVQGAVAAPADSVRNVAIVVNTQTGERLIDTESDRNIIFGRVDGPTTTPISGSLFFVNASDDVVGTDTKFTSELQIGDTILGADGRFYEVLTILDDFNLILRDAYIGVTATLAVCSARTWTLRLRKLVGGVESSATLPAAATLRFFFPAFFDRATAAFDNDIACLAPGTAPPLPAASTTVPGRVYLGAPTSLVGAVLINNNMVPLAGGPFHTINFLDGGGQVVQTTPGKVTIGEIGPAGPAGAAGTTGAAGPVGDPGLGFTLLNAWEPLPEIINPWPAPPSLFSITRAMGHNIKFGSYGIARFLDRGFTSPPIDYYDVATFGLGANPDELKITGQVEGDVNLIFYFASAGD